MHDMNSLRLPGAVVIAALMVMLLVSSSRTTYRLSPLRPAAQGYTMAASETRPVTLAPQADAVQEPDAANACEQPARAAWARHWRWRSHRADADVDAKLDAK